MPHSSALNMSLQSKDETLFFMICILPTMQWCRHHRSRHENYITLFPTFREVAHQTVAKLIVIRCDIGSLWLHIQRSRVVLLVRICPLFRQPRCAWPKTRGTIAASIFALRPSRGRYYSRTFDAIDGCGWENLWSTWATINFPEDFSVLKKFWHQMVRLRQIMASFLRFWECPFWKRS